MKIDIKPKLVTATDYRDFKQICDNAKELTGIVFDYWEAEPDYDYRAIVWPKGAENELFEFLFTNEEVWNILTKE